LLPGRGIVSRLLADTVATMRDAAAAAIRAGNHRLNHLIVGATRSANKAGPAGQAAGLTQHKGCPPVGKLI